MPSKQNLGKAFRAVRQAACLSQDDFSFASSRTFVSVIERGIKSPTIEKLSQLSLVMNSDPAVVVLLATLLERRGGDPAEELHRVVEAVEALYSSRRAVAKVVRTPRKPS